MAVQHKARYLPRLVGNPVEVFPPTKPPSIRTPKLMIHQRAEQGAHFLRNYYPDVDIPFDLIKDELQLDEKHAAMDSVLDPYAGNRLVCLSMETKRKQLTPFLAFTCGVTGSELNVSPFHLTRDKRYIFSPSATPTMAFGTPIQQIVSFPYKGATPQEISLLGVRTHAMVSVLKLQSSTSSDVGGPPVVAETAIPISTAETGNHRIVDMSTQSFSSNPQILLVNDMGLVYNCQIEGGRKAMSSPVEMPVNDEESDRFWRVAWKDVHSCMRASSRRVHLFDLRTPTTQPQELFCLKDIREYVTSLEAPLDNRHTLCFATTSKILWYDDRNSKRPILSLLHHRSFDRSLRIASIKLGFCQLQLIALPLPHNLTFQSLLATLTTLSSAANPLVTIYDVDYTSSGHFKMYGVPSLLPGSSALDLPAVGSLVFRPTDQEDQKFYHFQLSSRGSLWKTSVDLLEAVVDSSDHVPDDVEWDEKMHALGKKGRTMAQDVGTLGETEHIVANLRGVYEKMYDVHCDTTRGSEGDAEAVYQTLEKMPFFWQDMNGATDHMLTTFDIAFQCGSEPVHASRADFFAESLSSTTRGYMSLIRGRIPIPRLLFTAPWSHDMGSLPSGMVPNMLTPSQTLFDSLQKEAMAQAATPEGMQRVTEASQCLVLDLALSRHVYSSQSLSKACIDTSEVDGAEMLSRATKALSLGTTEPPQVQFQYFHPMAKITPKDDEHMQGEGGLNSDEKLDIPLGIRLLLSHWDVGSSPDDYSYKDPYQGKDPSLTVEILGTDSKEALRRVATQQASIAQRPPTIISSLPRQMLASQLRPHTQETPFLENKVISDTHHLSSLFAEDDVSRTQTQGTLSQDFPGPSTQPLPGPFGGGKRQLGTRKKVGKRMGGF